MEKSLHKQQVGERIAIIRTGLGMSQKAMADRYGMADKSQISNYERGLNYPDPFFVYQLWETEGITADFIYLGTSRNLPFWLVERFRPEAAEKGGGFLHKSKT